MTVYSNVVKHRMSAKLAVICAGAGVVLALAAWFLPVHLRALDMRVLRAAGSGPTVSDAATELARQNHFGAADLLRQAARRQKLPVSADLDKALAARPPAAPMTEVFIRTHAREAELARLQASSITAVRALLQTRALNNTRLFAPSSSSAGQAFDTAVVVAGCLIDQGDITGTLRSAIEAAAASANANNDTAPLEHMLLDTLSLGERLNLDQAGVFLSNIQEPETFSVLAEATRNAGSSLPTLFAAVVLSGQPHAVASYLRDYNDTALHDLAASLPYGSGAMTELLTRQERLYGAIPANENQLARSLDSFCLRETGFALTLKCLFYLLGGFFLAEAAHYARPQPTARERPLEVRGVHYARESLFAVGFLLVVLLLSEPFLAQGSQKMEIRLHLPTVGGLIVSGTASAKSLMPMNSSNTTLLTLLLFFVLQALLYVACLVKLAEVKRQNVAPRVRLKLLENEEHLFDAGLYLGFCGTIVSLILASLGITGWSLMAAYSSTSFGIIFVSIFKIFHLRPARRELLLQSEEDRPTTEAVVMTPSLATMP